MTKKYIGKKKAEAQKLLTEVYVSVAHLEYNLAIEDTDNLKKFRRVIRLLNMNLILPSEHGERD